MKSIPENEDEMTYNDGHGDLSDLKKLKGPLGQVKRIEVQALEVKPWPVYKNNEIKRADKPLENTFSKPKQVAVDKQITEIQPVKAQEELKSDQRKHE